jgi:hypothetical protein
MATERSLLQAIEDELGPHGFAPRSIAPSFDGIEIAAAWVRKTFNTNRAAIALRLPDGTHPGPVSERLKIPLGKALGYFPFFYGIGLQLVWLGADVGPLSPALDAFVDKIDNQRSIVQSLFVVDLARGTVESARTWGQVVTGKFQDAIERGLRNGLSLGG